MKPVVIPAAASLVLAALWLASCSDATRGDLGPSLPPIPAAPAPASATAATPAPSASATPAANATATAFPAPASATAPVDLPGLPNVVTYGDGFYCGGAPDGALGFATLTRLGIRTVISVDGTQPDVAGAKADGLRYVHLPIGYNGMDEQRTLEIAKAVRDLPGPIYIHCHHGKHRSAGAAAACMVTLGKLTVDQATARMHVSGTASVYKGLFACVKVAKPQAERLDAMPDYFPETTRTNALVDTMVAVDDAFDTLKDSEKLGWKAPPKHPDLVPAAEAGRLADYLRSAATIQEAKARPAEFAAWMNEGYNRANAVQEALAAGKDAAEVSTLFKAVGQSCTDCHGTYRN